MMLGMLSRTPSTRESVFAPLLQFKSAWPAGGWSWDNRFECLASTIAQASADEGWRAAQALFAHVWDEVTIRTAPASVLKVSAETGGVRAGQYLLSREGRSDLLIYGLWWPWGEEGSNISMRIGLSGVGARNEHNDLRDAFNAW